MRPILVLAALAVLAPAAGASVDLNAQCDGTTVSVSVWAFNDDYPPAWVGMVVERSWVGTCEPGVIVTAAPLDLPAPMEEIHHVFEDAVPEGDHAYWYRAFMVDADGELTPAPAGFEILPYDAASCGAAVLSRGFLLSGGPNFEACADLCWVDCYAGINLNDLPPEVWQPYVDSGIPVDIYGTAQLDGMPVVSCIFVSDVQPAPGGECGPVPARRLPWSAVKARYR
jgi:hypothetical protein